MNNDQNAAVSNQKWFPKVGDHLYLSQRTGNFYVDLVKNPYTVVEVTPQVVRIRACKLIFNGPRYYDTIADEIQDDPNGEILDLHWAPKKQQWQIDKYHTGYPDIAFFGEWAHQPYLD